MKFKAIFTDFQRQGLKPADVVRKLRESGIQVSQPTISKLARGETIEPAYSLGAAIVKIHNTVCANDGEV